MPELQFLIFGSLSILSKSLIEHRLSLSFFVDVVWLCCNLKYVFNRGRSFHPQKHNALSRCPRKGLLRGACHVSPLKIAISAVLPFLRSKKNKHQDFILFHISLSNSRWRMGKLLSALSKTNCCALSSCVVEVLS